MSGPVTVRFNTHTNVGLSENSSQVLLEIPGSNPVELPIDKISGYLKSLSLKPKYLVLIDGAHELVPLGIIQALDFLDQNPGVSFLYGQNFVGGSQSVNQRSIFDEIRIYNHNYLGDVGIIRTEIFYGLLTGSSFPTLIPIWACALLINENNQQIVHFPQPLYISEQNQQLLGESEKSSIQEFFTNRLSANLNSKLGEISSLGILNWDHNLQSNPLISIVIPSQGLLDGPLQNSYLYRCISSISELSSYTNFEIVLVLDQNYSQDLISELIRILGKKLRILLWEKPFNFSQKMNFGVLNSGGDYVLLLNDDVEVISPGWIEEMLKYAVNPKVGMAGAMLYYEDETIQHAGHAYYNGSPTHLGLGLPRGSNGPDKALLVERKVSGVTAACALMRKSVFYQAGGFTPLLPGNFNDVDLCMKVGFLGFDIVWTPKAELYHFESKSRDARVRYFELDFINSRWKSQLHDVRYWPFHPFAADV